MTGSLQVKGNKYYAVLNLSGPDGKRKQKWVSTGIHVTAKRREAEKILREIIKKYEDGKIDFSKEIDFGQWIAGWLEKHKERVELNTWEAYEMISNNYVFPYFKQNRLNLSAVRPIDIDLFYSYMRRIKPRNGKSEFSRSNLIKASLIVRGALNEALMQNLIAYNPSDRVSLPKMERKPAGKYLTPEQANKLLAAARGLPLETAVVLALFYGIRRSEILGLKWSAIDFENNTLVINNTIVKTRTVYEKPRTKTKSSCRTLPLFDNAREYLLALKERQKIMCEKKGETYICNDYVCVWNDGRQMKPDYISNAFTRLIKNTDLPQIRFHDLRHTCASMLLSMGYSLKEIGDWLGHSSYKTTADIYAHVDIKAKRAMGESIGEVFSVV